MEKTKWLRVYITCRKCASIFIYKYRIICEHCQDTYYCSTKCYRDDYSSHKNDCPAFNPGAPRISTNTIFAESPKSLSDLMVFKDVQKAKFPKTPGQKRFQCIHCHKYCDGSVSCLHCKEAYCSELCLDQSKAQHKPLCSLIALFAYVDEILLHGHTSQLLKTKGKTEATKTSFVLDNLVHEFAPAFGGPFYSLERPVIIVQIVSPYPHSWRYAVVVRDIHQSSLHIIFHDEQKTEAAITGGHNIEKLTVTKSPLSVCLKPGNFIILLDAWLHTFQDFTLGVRIDDLDKVHFVWSE